MNESGQNMEKNGAGAERPQEQILRGLNSFYAAKDGNTEERPLSVTIFGVLNCVFGVLGIVSAIGILYMWLGYDTTKMRLPNNLVKKMDANFIVTVISYAIYLAISVYLLILGNGLLKMKTWARQGTIICAWMLIIWSLATVLINIAISIALNVPGHDFIVLITRSPDGLKTGLVYPILLIIFMKTREVKEAFERIENG
jgi:hypothetical protein